MTTALTTTERCSVHLPVQAGTAALHHKTRWNALLCLSLANLSFLKVWDTLLDPYYLYFRSSPPRPLSWLTVLLEICLLFGALWILQRLAQRRPGGVAETAWLTVFLILILTAGNALCWIARPLLLRWLTDSELTVYKLGCAVLLCVFYLDRPVQLFRGLSVVVLWTSPLVPITFGQALWHALRPDVSSFAAHPVQSAHGRGVPFGHPRIVLVVFDEMSQQLAFEDRPRGVVMPAFDRLRSESLYASSAWPHNDWTTEAIPALLLGKPVGDARPLGPSLLAVNTGNGYSTEWVNGPNLITRMRGLNYSVGIVGFHHPYCRLFPFPLNACYRAPSTFPEIFPVAPPGSTLGDFAAMHFHTFIDSLPLAYTLRLGTLVVTEGQERRYRRQTAREVEALIRRAVAAAADPSLGFVFLHLPTPHPPGIYDRFSNDFSARPSATYFDNYRLADRALGMLREGMERAGMWDRTGLLIVADHSWRPWLWKQFSLWDRESQWWENRVDRRVPFLLKLPGQHKGLEYRRPVQNIVAADLLVAVARGEVRTPEQAAAWLQAHGAP